MELQETHALLVILSAIDNRPVSQLTVKAWHGVLGRYRYDEVEPALYKALEHVPFNLRPAHIVEQIRIARARHAEVYGIHPPPPEGKRWAVDVIEDDRELEPPTRAIEP